MSFACPHFDIDRDYCRRLQTDCVPGRPGCVLAGSVFATPIEQRLREREEENRRRALEKLEIDIRAAAKAAPARTPEPCGPGALIPR